jgi:hypothetical protein
MSGVLLPSWKGEKIGRPRVIDRRGFKTRYKAIVQQIASRSISRRQAARELGIGYAASKGLLDDDPNVRSSQRIVHTSTAPKQ